MPFDLFKLSFPLQLSLASGYLAYVIAYAGIRQHHTTSDAVFKTVAFSVIASTIMFYGYQLPFWTAAVAFTCTLTAGIFWRWRGLRWWCAILRAAKIVWADDIPSAWLSITATDTESSPSQIAVTTLDDRILFCEDTRLFKKAHQGPVVLGLTGDVGLYVTAEMRPSGEWDEKIDVQHNEGGLITYIPASQIKRVELRYLSEKAAKAAARAAAEQAEEPQA